MSRSRGAPAGGRRGARSAALAGLAGLGVLASLLAGCGPLGQGSTVVSTPTPTPAPAVAPIPHDCTTDANTGLNPDPSRYLAVVARDAAGAPIAQTGVNVAWYSQQGINLGWSTYLTDGQGVATPMDLSTLPPYPAGSLEGFVAVDGTATTPALFSACGTLPVPGTLTLTAADPGSSTLTLTLHAGSDALANAEVLPGYRWNGVARLAAGFAPGSTGQARLLDGSYLLGLSGQAAGASYVLYRPLTVSGDTSVDVDAATAPSYHLTLDATDAGGAPGDAFLGLFREGNDVEQVHGLVTRGTDVYLTPGDYQVNASLALPAGLNATWYYGFAWLRASFAPAGAAGTMTLGGPLTASLTPSAATVAPGDTLTLHPSVTDAAGHQLHSVSSFDTTQGSVTAKPTIEVDGPSGTMVQSLTSPTLSDDQVTLQPSAASGTYTATLSWDLGPYQASPLTVSTTFQVQ